MNLNKHVSTTQILEFEVAFPDEQPLTVEEYLKGGERDIVLQTVALLLSFPSLNDNEEMLRKIFGDENTAFANKVYDKIKATEVKIEITNTYSSLKLWLFISSSFLARIQKRNHC